MSRVLIVSNRLPVTVRSEGGRLEIANSSGGLATGMRGPHQSTGGLWFGWPGTTGQLSPELQTELERRLDALRLVPVSISAAEVERYYEGFSNAVLWPLFHGFPALMPLEIDGFDTAIDISRRFADAVVARYQDGDLIWVHDYQLMLLPAMLRQRLPRARIGFFLHIPFPPQSIFRTLPQRAELLRGVLGADLIGVHTSEYARALSSSVLRVLGQPEELGSIPWEGRSVQIAAFPMGIDAAHFQRLGEDPEVQALAREFRGSSGGQLLVGIDRLDYTKGIPRRLLAFEKLLENWPELRERVRLVQVAVPSRTGVGAYQEFREQIDGLIGRIHGRFATPSWSPVHYLYRGLAEKEVVALYRAADAMLVTPIRDGMNLVAKEFVAARSDEEGVLVLSEFTGAAAELAEAVQINPYDVIRSAEAIHRALTLDPASRRRRMRALRRRVLAFEVHHWAATFLRQLEGVRLSDTPAVTSGAAEVEAAISTMREASKLTVLLDYDGTLVPFAESPELAAPDAALLSLLGRLAARPGLSLAVVSGRRRDLLEEWLGALPIHLCAEHGLWMRPPGAAWQSIDVPTGPWMDLTRRILADWTARTPGSLTEEKARGFAWHYRMTDPQFGISQAHELKLHLVTVLSNAPVEVMLGDKVIEVRPQGVSKALAVRALGAAHPGSKIVAIGDDRTDEDMFSVVPADGLSIAAGPNPRRATLRVGDHNDVRALLQALC